MERVQPVLVQDVLPLRVEVAIAVFSFGVLVAVSMVPEVWKVEAVMAMLIMD